MSIGINTNMAALISQTNLAKASNLTTTSAERLSSGLRVNSAKDDAAGLAIATRMDSQIRGMQVAQRNAADVISIAQTADGALASMTENLQRMRELAVQSKNETLTEEDRAQLNQEYQSLGQEIGRVLDNTTFNKTAVFDSSIGVFQVGPGNAPTDSLSFHISNPVNEAFYTSFSNPALFNDLSGAGFYAAPWATSIREPNVDFFNTGTFEGADYAIESIDFMLTHFSKSRAELGALQSRVESSIENLATSIQNTTAAKGRIVDADYAKETLNLSKSNVLQQAGMAMLAQANQQAGSVLSLLR